MTDQSQRTGECDCPLGSRGRADGRTFRSCLDSNPAKGKAMSTHTTYRRQAARTKRKVERLQRKTEARVMTRQQQQVTA